jgi:Xaa-Pro aminopeptidase
MENRLKKLRSLMIKQDLDAIFISSIHNINYLTGFSGFSSEDRDAFLLISKSEQFIFTHGIYKEAAEKYIKEFELIEMKRENPVSQSIKYLLSRNKIKKLGFESFDLRVSEYEKLLKSVGKKILSPADLTSQLRLVKSSDEIDAIKNACELGDKTFDHILKIIKKDLAEKQLVFEIEMFIKKNGADISFPTIVAFGPNASYPHHVPTDLKLELNNFVLLDFGVKMDNYCSDMTRTIFFGKSDSEQKKLYNSVLESQTKAVTQIEKLLQKNIAINGAEIDKISRDYIISKGYPTTPHSLGHGIGLEVHEIPSLSPVTDHELKNGMVFSIEPGIYLPDNMGVRIEDLYAIQNNKLISLTHSPKELIEI